MIATVERSWYVPAGRDAGQIHIWLTEDISALTFGEVISGPRPRRRRKRREIVLQVEGNLPDYSGLMPWERELLIPVVTRVLEEVLRTAELTKPGGVETDECAAREEG